MQRSRAIYIAMFVGTLAAVAGYALAAVTLTNSSQTGGGNYVNAAGAVTGLTYTSTVLSAVPSSAPSGSTGTASTPQTVASGANNVCGNTCTAGDFAQVATYTFTTSMTGSVQIVIQVTATSSGGSTTLYFKQAGTAVAGTIVVYWDLGSASNSLTATTLTVQQCSGASCP